MKSSFSPLPACRVNFAYIRKNLCETKLWKGNFVIMSDIQGLKKQLEAAEEAEKLAAAAAAGDEAAKKAAAEQEEAEGPVIVEEEYRDVVMAGPQGGFFSR
jgi:hypothetical protein